MFRRSAHVLALAVLVTAVASSSLAGAAPQRAGAAVDPQEDCAEAGPATYSTDPVAGSAAPVNLEVTVLLDGITRTDAARIMGLAAESYAPLDVALVPRFKRFPAPGDAGKVEVTALMAAAKRLFGGARPPGTDLVHVLTRKDIYFTEGDGLNGLADCLGGVRYPGRAFSISELFVTAEPGSVRGDEHGSMIAAHEIGHLLGGHHEYANCAQGPAPAVCTLMFPYYLGNFGPGLGVPVNSRTFGTLEGAVVRGYAEDFAAP